MANVGELKPVYNFDDISIFCRVDTKDKGNKRGDCNEYVNLTDFTFSRYDDTPLVEIGSKARLLIVLCTYAKKDIYFSEITIEELFTLAGIKGDKFITQATSGIDEPIAEEIVARMCANKMVNYQYGKVEQTADRLSYNFKRMKYEPRDGGKVRTYPIVLTKTFQKGTKRMTAY